MDGEVNPQQVQMNFVRNMYKDRLSLALSQMLTYDEFDGVYMNGHNAIVLGMFGKFHRLKTRVHTHIHKHN